MSRAVPRIGVVVAVAGAVAIAVALFALSWYGVDSIDVERFGPGEAPGAVERGLAPGGSIVGRDSSGSTIVLSFGDREVGAWTDQELLGTLANLLMLAAAALALAIAAAHAAGRRVPRRVERAAALMAAAAVATVALRIAFPIASDASLEGGIFVALGSAVALALGSLLALRGRGAAR